MYIQHTNPITIHLNRKKKQSQIIVKLNKFIINVNKPDPIVFQFLIGLIPYFFGTFF